jgi:hypothetical protein
LPGLRASHHEGRSNTKISGEPPFWPWLVRCILLLASMLDIVGRNPLAVRSQPARSPPLGPSVAVDDLRNELAVGRLAWLLMRTRRCEVATRASNFLRCQAPIRSAALEGDRGCRDAFKASVVSSVTHAVTPVVLTGVWPTPRSAARAATGVTGPRLLHLVVLRPAAARSNHSGPGCCRGLTHVAATA